MIAPASTLGRQLLSRLWLLVAPLVLGACAMTESLYLSPIGSQTCVSQGGSYYLSKSYLTVAVNRVESVAADGKSDGPSTFELAGISVSPQPDRAQLYCLDYRASPTANDTLLIEKTDTNLLHKITSNAEDRSGAIAENLIQAVFVGLSQNPDFDRTLRSRSAKRRPPSIGENYVKMSFDPFDQAQLDLANDSLRQTGFCVLLERGDDEDLRRKRDIDRYCDHPLGGDKREWKIEETTQDLEAYKPPEILGPIGDGTRGEATGRSELRRSRQAGSEEPVITQGILYRPRVAHSIVLFAKSGRGNAGRWQLRSRASLLMENNSPTIALGIDRAFFAKRNTVVEFDNGVLRDIKITKESELLGFANIPLQIAQSITALPANIIQVRIQNTNNRAELIAAQEQLLRTKREMVDYRATLAGNSPATGAPPPKPPGGIVMEDGGSTVRSAGLPTAPGAGLLDNGPPRSGVPRSSGAGWDSVVESGGQVANPGAAQANPIDQCVSQCARSGEVPSAQCRNVCACQARCLTRDTPAACRIYCSQGAN